MSKITIKMGLFVKLKGFLGQMGRVKRNVEERLVST